MQIIENIKILMSVDHIAWADGPGYLLALVLTGAVMLIVGACVGR